MNDFQTKLGAIAAERIARNDLVTRRVAERFAEAQARTDDLTKAAEAELQALHERAGRTTAAGWERQAKPDPNESLGMDFEDPDLATERTDRHAAPGPPPRRPRPTPADDFEDDYSTKDWLA